VRPAIEAFDLLVIDGGVNGTGIARDAALRGLSTLLVERKDFAAGASGARRRLRLTAAARQHARQTPLFERRGHLASDHPAGWS
jgi:glycine/D-amino acid oxidase-like deaminating enzyme